MKIYVIFVLMYESLWWIKLTFLLKKEEVSLGKNLIKMYFVTDLLKLYAHLRGFTSGKTKLKYIL